jgi:two-component system, chemotaxis family, CheB/CheR fusion protein
MAKNQRKQAKPAREAALRVKEASSPAASSTGHFPVVGIGASAGDLDAFTRLLRELPADTGMAFVLIQRVDPNHESILPSQLSGATKMPIHQVTDRLRLEANQVYVSPPNTNLALKNFTLRLKRLDPTVDHYMPIDHFLQSLAQSQEDQAIGVILSGTASDGAAGLRAIKNEGGITFAQDAASARFDRMPRNAISANVVDFVLTPEGIARELANISRHPYVASGLAVEAHEIGQPDQSEFTEVFALLRAQTGTDFSSYKRGTIGRRLRRRMVMHKIEALEEYVDFLQGNRDEVMALYEDLLINVTEFFRDPKTFEFLRSDIFPELLKDRAPDAPIRVWVAGCSTGEEAYSLAMSLLDYLDEQHANNPVQMFGTDLSEVAISKARLGWYSESVAARVRPDFLQRFFTKVDHRYRIGKRIRDVCVFARQDLTKDPPFSKVDLISCRNVLIYLNQDLQNNVAPVFHYALKPGGYLLLGSSESVPPSNLFTTVDKNHKVYRKRDVAGSPALDFLEHFPSAGRLRAPAPEEPRIEYNLRREVERIVLAKYAPAGVVVTEQREIVHFLGNLSPYLQPASGAASLNLLRLVRGDLLTELREAIDLAKSGAGPIRREGLRMGDDEGRLRNFNLEVLPLAAPQDRKRLFLVLFEHVPTVEPRLGETAKAGPEEASAEESAELARLKQELAATKGHLQFLMDERQASEEELRSANEEILSSNEELQSTNEELETSQEELQSANEELVTVNDELQNRNVELAKLGNDLSNLLNSVSIPIVMLDNSLHVRHFTPAAERVLNVRSTDVGRSIVEIRSNLDIRNLESLLISVVADLAPIEMDVQDRSGSWYSMRIRPYRTEDNRIDGAVVVLYDVDQLKRSLQEVRRARDFSQAIVETVPKPIVILDADLKVVIANRAFYETFHLHRKGTEGVHFHELSGGLWNVPALRENLSMAMDNHSFEDFEMEADFPRIGKRTLVLQGRRLELDEERRRILLLALQDITAQKLAEEILEKSLRSAESSLRESEEDLRQSREELRALAARLLTTQEEERRRVSRELHDDLNQKLAMLEVDADRLGQHAMSTPGLNVDIRSLRDRVTEVSNDIRRVAYQLHPSILDHLGLRVALRSYCTEFSKREGMQVKFSGPDQTESVPEEVALCLYRVAQEGLRNVAKHAAAKSASVTLETVDQRIHLSVRDNGAGFDAAAKQGRGIGLLSMKERVRLVDGEFTLRSKPGHGTRIDVWAPLTKRPA